MCLAAGGFVLGESIILLSLTSGLILVPALLAAGLAVVCRNTFRNGRRKRDAVWLSVFLLFVLLGMARAGYAECRWIERQEACGEMAGKYVNVEGRLKEIEESDGTLQLTLEKNEVTAVKGDGSGIREIPGILVSWKNAEEGRAQVSAQSLKPGMKIAVKGMLELFDRARNPGEFDARSYYRAQGLDCRMYGEGVVITDERYSPLSQLLRKLKRAAKANIKKSADPKDAGVYAAAVLGDKKELDRGIKDLYQRNGIAHLLAISGLHLSLIGLGVYKLLRKAGLGYGGAGLAGCGFIAAYGLMTGGSPSVVRAVIMMSMSFLASYSGRTYDLSSAASLALLLLAWKSPDLMTQGGVLLSFGAVFAIGCVLPVIEEWSGKKKGILGALTVSASIQLVTLPVILWNFFQFPVYGIFLNLLVIPLMGGVICSGIGTALMGGLSVQAGIMAAGPGHYILKFYQWICGQTERLPFHTLVTGRPEPGTIIVYYAVLIVVLMWMKRKGQTERNDHMERRGRPARVRMAIVLLFCALTPCILMPRPVRGLEVLFLDVGQGDGILLRSGRSAVLIDGGSTSEKKLGEYRLEPCLKSCGVSVIEYAFVSHGDQDHMSGVKYLLEKSREIEIRNLVLSCQSREDEALKDLAGLAEARGTSVSYIEAGDGIDLGKMTVNCLYPGPEDIPGDKNEESEVLKVDYGDCHILFTGDMSSDGEMRLLSALSETPGELSEIQVLKTAHHGSRFSSESAFLNALGIKWAVISYAEGNSYGHPHREVVERLEERGVKIYKTAEGGAVTMKTDGRTVKWKRFLR